MPKLLLSFLLAALLTILFPLVFLQPEIITRDWAYFQSLSLLVRSSVLSYGHLPIHDPWCGGGLNVLANPQTRIFSPLGVLDILLPPYWANLGGLAILAFAGLWGMYRLLTHLRVPSRSAAIGAVLFINGTWFGLHFAEGHIPFGDMQLLPWVLYAFLTIERRSSMALMAGLFALFLLDGAIYAFIFSLLLVSSAFIAGLKSRRQLLAGMRAHPGFTVLCLIGALLAVAPKVIPVYLEHGQRTPQLDSFAMGVKALLTSFFWPAQKLTFKTAGSPFSFHEFGCYLGVLLFPFILATAITDRGFRRSNLRFAALFLFWLWVGGGWLGDYNPWRLFQRLPLINNAHLQSRLLILAFFFYMIIAARALATLRADRWVARAFVAALLLESVFVRNYPFEHYLSEDRREVTFGLIRNTTIRETEFYIVKPHLYVTHNRASQFCYEPAQSGAKPRIKSDPDYRGEIHVETGTGKAWLDWYVPARMEIRTSGSERLNVVVNTKDLGWEVERGPDDVDPAIVISRKNELLKVAVGPGEKRIRLKLTYPYLRWIILSWIAGICLLAMIAVRARRADGRPDPQASG